MTTWINCYIVDNVEHLRNPIRVNRQLVEERLVLLEEIFERKRGVFLSRKDLVTANILRYFLQLQMATGR